MGLVIVLVPVFAGERLDSVGLIATTTGLLHLCLFTDLAGNVLDARVCKGKKKNEEEEEEEASHVVRVP